jgi:hypothetical protein
LVGYRERKRELRRHRRRWEGLGKIGFVGVDCVLEVQERELVHAVVKTAMDSLVS